MADYTTLAQVKAEMPDSTLFQTIDFDSAVETYITRASRLIDREVGRENDYFSPSTDDATRYYDGSRSEELWIDPMISLTSVSVAESGGRQATDYTDWTENTDYYVWPYNYANLGLPIEKLVIDNDSGNKGKFHGFKKSVKVTGRFGYSSTPPSEVAQACTIQVMRWVMRSKGNWQDARQNAQTGGLIYAKELDPDIKRLLMNYKIGAMVL